jgi:inhibitor of cysteine peptidase
MSMKKLPILILFLLLVALLVSAYIGRNSSVTQINLDDAGKTIQLTIGDKLEVNLEGNPSTGYTWEVLSGQELLEQSEEIEFTAASQQLVGSSGEMRFEFEAIAAGETTLTMGYLRPFERDIDPLQTYSVSVIVK